MSVIPQEPYSGTLSWLHNLYPRSTQETDVISSINFLNPNISCPFILLFNSVKQLKSMLLEYWDDAVTVTVTVIVYTVNSSSNCIYDE